MIDGKTVIAIIPARKGSQGIPGKNYRYIEGRPLIEWSILAALQSESIDEIVVSTNCLICEDIALECSPRVKVICRPDNLSAADSKTEDAMIHSLDNIGKEFDIVCLLQPTSPLRQKDLVDRSLRLKNATKSKSLLTVSPHTPFFFKIQDGKSKSMFDVQDRKMRQDIDEEGMLYHDDGCLYLTDVDLLRQTGCRLDDHPFLLVNDAYSSFQIDSEVDFTILSKIMDEVRKNDKYI